jgi:hypothetical protein
VDCHNYRIGHKEGRWQRRKKPYSLVVSFTMIKLIMKI